MALKVVRLPARLSLKFAVGLFPFFRIPPTASIPLHPLAALALPLPPSVPSSYPASLSLPPFPSLPPQLLPPPTPIALSYHAGAVCYRLSPHVKQQSHFNHQPGRQGGGAALSLDSGPMRQHQRSLGPAGVVRPALSRRQCRQPTSAAAGSAGISTAPCSGASSASPAGAQQRWHARHLSIRWRTAGESPAWANCVQQMLAMEATVLSARRRRRHERRANLNLDAGRVETVFRWATPVLLRAKELFDDADIGKLRWDGLPAWPNTYSLLLLRRMRRSRPPAKTASTWTASNLSLSVPSSNPAPAGPGAGVRPGTERMSTRWSCCSTAGGQGAARRHALPDHDGGGGTRHPMTSGPEPFDCREIEMVAEHACAAPPNMRFAGTLTGAHPPPSRCLD